MNFLKVCAIIAMGFGGLTNQDILFIISIILIVLGMLQDYLKTREELKCPPL